MVKVLIAVTSFNNEFYEDGKKTGLFLTEALHPFQVFHEKGYDITFASETGSFGYDEHSLTPDFLTGETKEIYEDKNSPFNKAIGAIKKASDLNASDYDIFFAAGGHGCLFDFHKAEHLQNILRTTYENGNVVAAVCHGPDILLLNNSKGEPLIKGKKITGFTDEGEDVLGITSTMEKHGLLTIKQTAEKEGATYISPNGPWDNFTVIDGKLVTGVNPQSAEKTAVDSIKALEG